MAAPPPPPSPAHGAAEAFSDAMDDFARAWHRARMRLRDDDGLSIAQFHLLRPLLDAPDGALGVGELAHTAGVSAPTATRMVDGLVRDGLCARTRGAEDRRCVKVSLTAAGRTAADERRGGGGARGWVRVSLRAAGRPAADERLARNEERRRQLFAALTPEERRDAEPLLTRLAAAIEELA